MLLECFTKPLKSDKESLRILKQVSIPIICSAIGTFMAGYLLDSVQIWVVFMQIPEMYVMVPPLLGLKGNLEMTMSSRLTTQANLGKLDDPKVKKELAVANLCLVQFQAITLALIGSLLGFLGSLIPSAGAELTLNKMLVLSASAIATASLTSLLIGVLLILIIHFCRKQDIDPDNVSTPIASTLGDIMTLGILAVTSTLLNRGIECHAWICPFIIVIAVLSLPFWAITACKNEQTLKVIKTGWLSIFVAFGLSSVGGMFLDYDVKKFQAFAALLPIVSGIGGNLISIQASRMSTALHLQKQKEESEESTEVTKKSMDFSIYNCLFSKDIPAVTARILTCILIPMQIFLVWLVSICKSDHVQLTLHFLIFYTLVCFLHLVILLYINHILIQFLWARGVDPDSSAIPYMTALGDLLGALLFIGALYTLKDYFGEQH